MNDEKKTDNKTWLPDLNWSLMVFLVLWFAALAVLMFSVPEEKMNEQQMNSATNFETSRLYFAAFVLSGLGLIFVLAVGVLAFTGGPGVGDKIFDACKTIIPPIVTLVLGFYFGQTQTAPSVSNSPSSGITQSSVQASASDKTD